MSLLEVSHIIQESGLRLKEHLSSCGAAFRRSASFSTFFKTSCTQHSIAAYGAALAL